MISNKVCKQTLMFIHIQLNLSFWIGDLLKSNYQNSITLACLDSRPIHRKLDLWKWKCNQTSVTCRTGITVYLQRIASQFINDITYLKTIPGFGKSLTSSIWFSAAFTRGSFDDMLSNLLHLCYPSTGLFIKFTIMY